MDLLFISPDEGVKDVENNTNATDGASAQSNDNTQTLTEQPAPASKAKESGKSADLFGDYSLWIMIVAMIAIMYFFMWRPESKRRKQMQKFRDGLKKGDKIITAGGIYGVIKEVKGDNTVLIEVDGNVTLRVDKGMIVGDPNNK